MSGTLISLFSMMSSYLYDIRGVEWVPVCRHPYCLFSIPAAGILATVIAILIIPTAIIITCFSALPSAIFTACFTGLPATFFTACYTGLPPTILAAFYTGLPVIILTVCSAVLPTSILSACSQVLHAPS
jgi:hypothetical protein